MIILTISTSVKRLPTIIGVMMDRYYVYRIRNVITNKLYFGETNDIKRRFGVHKSAINMSEEQIKKSCPRLYRSMQKHGAENFEYTILEDYATKEEALAAETAYIIKFDTIKNGYNILLGNQKQSYGENHPWYGRHHTDETKKKISDHHITTGACAGEKNGMYGKHHSQEAKNKIGTSNTGKIRTQEALNKLSVAFKGEKNPAAKITKEIADKIRAEYVWREMTAEFLGKKYGITKRMVLNILHNRNWT
jgi:group I intron endonuclease